ncbi:hypothetical protein MW887_008605 [Aspergillus wentii]|nr:hypothetical protein MW887_008605 [Aspergillus wentii]
MDMLLYQLVFPWANVVCLFADNLGGLEGVRTMLASLPDWVTSSNSLKDEDTFVQDVIWDAKVSHTFSSVHPLHLPVGTDLYDEARHQYLKEAVLKKVWTSPSGHEHYAMSYCMSSQRFTVGGFPSAMQWLMDQQRLSARFGVSNHGRPARDRCPSYARRRGGRIALWAAQFPSRKWRPTQPLGIS